LFLKYQETRDPDLFVKIIKRVDKTVVRTVCKYLRQYRYLKCIELQDLYHCGLIGVSEAILSMPSDEDPDKVEVRVGAYVKANIKKTYSYLGRYEQRVDIDNIVDPVLENKDIDRMISREDILKKSGELYKSDILTKQELELLRQYVIEGKSQFLISQVVEMSSSWVSFKIQGALNKLSKVMENSG